MPIIGPVSSSAVFSPLPGPCTPSADFYWTSTTHEVPGPPTRVQIAVERAQTHVNFLSNNTPGNLLLYAATWRPMLTTPNPPNDGETWTLLGTGHFYNIHDTPTPLLVTYYATICTIAQSSHLKGVAAGGAFNGAIEYSCMYELNGPNADLAHISVISINDQSPVGTQNIGSLGLVTASQTVYGAWGNGYDGFFEDPNGNVTISGIPFVRDYLASRDFDTTSSDTLFCAGYGMTWFAHAEGAGITLAEMSVSYGIGGISSRAGWGGVAVTVG